ncbi:hypothetical protein HMPREF0742_02185 [Rothia aeria F0184]|uniref:Uncharacterized protein n=1 Tax=Rothia aeria F0184 TaxID=888019 RepID=U7UZT5_9MICC|nr:hypothetical protein HMPREF0742_02185 [Rothia aeria F0184]
MRTPWGTPETTQHQAREPPEYSITVPYWRKSEPLFTPVADSFSGC